MGPIKYFHNKFRSASKPVRWGMIGAMILPLFYIVPMVISHYPDFVINVLGPFGIIIWLIQWISFIIGGWAFAIASTIIFFILSGYVFGFLIAVFLSKKGREYRVF